MHYGICLSKQVSPDRGAQHCRPGNGNGRWKKRYISASCHRFHLWLFYMNVISNSAQKSFSKSYFQWDSMNITTQTVQDQDQRECWRLKKAMFSSVKILSLVRAMNWKRGETTISNMSRQRWHSSYYVQETMFRRYIFSLYFQHLSTSHRCILSFRNKAVKTSWEGFHQKKVYRTAVAKDRKMDERKTHVF